MAFTRVLPLGAVVELVDLVRRAIERPERIDWLRFA